MGGKVLRDLKHKILDRMFQETSVKKKENLFTSEMGDFVK